MDDETKISRYFHALVFLAQEDRRYKVNQVMWSQQSKEFKLAWMNYVENKGAGLPIAKAVRAKLVELRLTGVIK